MGETLIPVAGCSGVLRDVSFANLTDAAARDLATFPNLQTINCRSSPITGDAIESLAKLRKLTTLYFSNCSNLNDEDFTPLARLYELRQLAMDGTRAGDATVRSLARSIKLQDLRIGSENLTDLGLADVCNMVALRELSIGAEAVNVTDAGFRDFWRLANLRNLTVRAPKVGAAAFGVLAELQNLSRLSLKRDGTAVTDEGVQKLQQRLSDVKVDVR